jgi:superfamily II DNA/RNA helicase
MKIVNNVRPDRQTVLFSATFPRQASQRFIRLIIWYLLKILNSLKIRHY